MLIVAQRLVQDFVDEHIICANPSAPGKELSLYEYQYVDHVRRNCPYYPPKKDDGDKSFLTIDDLNMQFSDYCRMREENTYSMDNIFSKYQMWTYTTNYDENTFFWQTMYEVVTQWRKNPFERINLRKNGGRKFNNCVVCFKNADFCFENGVLIPALEAQDATYVTLVNHTDKVVPQEYLMDKNFTAYIQGNDFFEQELPKCPVFSKLWNQPMSLTKVRKIIIYDAAGLPDNFYLHDSKSFDYKLCKHIYVCYPCDRTGLQLHAHVR